MQDFNTRKEPFENVCWKYRANKLFFWGGGLYALQFINPIILKGLFFSYLAVNSTAAAEYKFFIMNFSLSFK